jgi:hypothetical protein
MNNGPHPDVHRASLEDGCKVFSLRCKPIHSWLAAIVKTYLGFHLLAAFEAHLWHHGALSYDTDMEVTVKLLHAL